jgi:hypothetical protein
MCCDKVVSPEIAKVTINDILNRLPQAVYGANTPHNPLKSLGATLPVDDGVVRKFGRPQVLDDGSIQYPPGDEHPPEINGYARDENNPFLFHPLWPECLLRMQGTRLDRKSGAINVSMVCNSPEAKDHFMKYVKHTDCEGCPFRKARENQ